MALNYHAAYEGLEEEFRELTKRREDLTIELEELNNKLQSLSAAIKALAPLIESNPIRKTPLASTKDFEITASVRDVLRGSKSALSAPDIRIALMGRGWNSEDYENPLAVVHTVLKRLIKSGDAKRVRGHENTYKYTYSGSDSVAVVEKVKENKYRRPLDNPSKPIDPKLRLAIAEVSRDLLRSAQKAMSGPALYHALIKRGVDMSVYSAPMSALSQVLRRMPDVEAFRAPQGGVFRTFFKWKEKGRTHQGGSEN